MVIERHVVLILPFYSKYINQVRGYLSSLIDQKCIDSEIKFEALDESYINRSGNLEKLFPEDTEIRNIIKNSMYNEGGVYVFRAKLLPRPKIDLEAALETMVQRYMLECKIYEHNSGAELIH